MKKWSAAGTITSVRGSGRRSTRSSEPGSAPELVLVSLDEEPRGAASVQEGRVRHHGEREAQREEGAHAGLAAAHAQGHRGPEGEAAQDEGEPGEAARGLVQGGPHVLLLPAPVVVDALAAAHAPEVEAQGGQPRLLQRAGGPEHDLEVHHPAVAGVRVAHDGRRHRRRVRIHEDALEPAGGPGDVERLVAAHAQDYGRWPADHVRREGDAPERGSED